MSRISFQLAALASSTFSYLRMPALLMRRSSRPNFCAAPLTKARHAASVPTSACVKATLAPAVSSSAATRWPRSPSRSQNATLAPSATKRLTVASPIPDAPPVTAATLPSSLPMFATLHCITKRASTIRRIHPAGAALLARPGCPTLTGCGSFGGPLSRPFDGLTRSDLGRFGGGFEQQVIDDRFVLVGDVGDRSRQGEDDMEIGHRQQLSSAVGAKRLPDQSGARPDRRGAGALPRLARLRHRRSGAGHLVTLTEPWRFGAAPASFP